MATQIQPIGFELLRHLLSGAGRQLLAQAADGPPSPLLLRLCLLSETYPVTLPSLEGEEGEGEGAPKNPY